MPYAKLDQMAIIAALRRLGELAAAEGTAIEICIYGGTAMMLAYNARAATKDVDALVRPRDIGLRLAKQVAAEMGLVPDWLNDDVRIFLSNHEYVIPADFKPLIKTNGLTVRRPTASYLFSMKCRACRPAMFGYDGDIKDLKFLVRKMEIRSISDVYRHFERFYPEEMLPESSETILKTIIRETWGAS